MIRLICVNDDCKYSYDVSEKELTEYSGYHKKCLICGSQLKVTQESLNEIVGKDLYTQANELLDKWVKEIGWDNTIDLIKRHKEQPCYRIYKDILKKRGFNIKD
jgi:hypothetical protein